MNGPFGGAAEGGRTDRKMHWLPVDFGIPLSIIVNIWRKDGRRRTTLLYILLGMSIYDIGASSMYVVGSWAIPRDVHNPNTFQPSGSMQTCRAQAFLFQTFASAVPMYNLSAAVYSYSAINRSWREELAHDQFNPTKLWCWFSGTEQSDMLKFIVYYGPLWVVLPLCLSVFSHLSLRARTRRGQQTGFARRGTGG